MQQEKDLILREIQRLSLALTKLIGKALGINVGDFEMQFKNIELGLRNEFDLTLKEISEMDNSELTDKIRQLDEGHLEQIAELITIMVGKLPKDFGIKVAAKGITILDFLDESSKTFSLKRAELKNMLQQYL